MNHLISIVTVVYNDIDHIENTIQSVLNQKEANIEYIIIDGESTDGTADVIQSYEYQIDFWISESDQGVFDAMNKGIERCRGEWVIFMNSGDTFAHNHVVASIDFSSHKSYAILYGDTIRKYNGTLTYPYSLTSLQYGLIMACHQSMFFNKALLEGELFYDTSKFQLLLDYELVARLYKKGYTFFYLENTIANYLGDGLSFEISWKSRKAKYFFVFKYFGPTGVLKTLAQKLFDTFNRSIVTPIKPTAKLGT